MAGAAASGFSEIDELTVGAGGELAARLVAPSEARHRFAWVGRQGSAAELFSEMATLNDETLLVFAPSSQAAGWCFFLVEQRVVGAVGPAPDGTFESWSAAFDTRHGPADEQEARRRETAFNFESAIAALACCDSGGAKAWVSSGKIEWLAHRHPVERSPGIGQIVLEYARRQDELPSVRRTVGDSERILVPVSEPAARPTRPADRDAHDFHDDPDRAALAEWRDVRRVWGLCDGTLTIGRVIERAMLGEFRGLAAVSALLERGHVAAVEGLAHGVPVAANRSDYGEAPAAEADEDDTTEEDAEEDDALDRLRAKTEEIELNVAASRQSAAQAKDETEEVEPEELDAETLDGEMVEELEADEALDDAATQKAAPTSVPTAPSIELDLSDTGPVDALPSVVIEDVRETPPPSRRVVPIMIAGVLLALAGGAWAVMVQGAPARTETPANTESAAPPAVRLDTKPSPISATPPVPTKPVVEAVAAPEMEADELEDETGVDTTAAAEAAVDEAPQIEDEPEPKRRPRPRPAKRSRSKPKRATNDDMSAAERSSSVPEPDTDALPPGDTTPLPNVDGSGADSSGSSEASGAANTSSAPAPSEAPKKEPTEPAGLPPAPAPDNPAFGVPASRPTGDR